jgi:hypothetical protein
MEKPTYSIAVQTYVYRFDSYFKVLLANLHRQRPSVEKVIFVNGQNNEPFSEDYRRGMLNYASNFPNTYLVMSPFMRGCSFMWNTSVNFTSHDYTLILSDDTIFKDGFFDDFEKMLVENRTQSDESFRINYHWGHFCVYRKDMTDPSRVGYFDERLIGFGEEDGDWMWRFENRFGRHMRNYLTPNLLYNCDEKCLPGKNTKTKPNSKYTAYNTHFMFGMKMEEDPTGTNKACGCMATPFKTRTGMETPHMYPGETWFRENRHEL